MASETLDAIGRILMGKVRDKAITDWDMILDGRLKGGAAEDVRQQLQTASPNVPDLLTAMVPRIVDTVLHHLLWTLEQEESVELSIRADGSTYRSVRDESDGLCGELYGDRGWIARFSQERTED